MPCARWGDTWRVQIDFPGRLGMQVGMLAESQHLSSRLWMLALLGPEPSCCSEEEFLGKASGEGATCRLSGFIPYQNEVDGCFRRPGNERMVMASRFSLWMGDGLWRSPCYLGGWGSQHTCRQPRVGRGGRATCPTAVMCFAGPTAEAQVSRPW